MKENLFLSMEQDGTGRHYVLNTKVTEQLPPLIKDINNNPGFLFLKCETTSSNIGNKTFNI